MQLFMLLNRIIYLGTRICFDWHVSDWVYGGFSEMAAAALSLLQEYPP